ncbi:MAG: DEAD/DEAH box helicase family protein [Desulfotalea sp.]
MKSNFSYLEKDAKYSDISIACMEAEKAMAISYSAAAFQTRKALEIAVKWAFKYDEELTIPYQDNLSSLIHDYGFREILDEKIFPRIKYIITLGNKAAHTTKPVYRNQIIESLRNLFDFISWIDFSYSPSGATNNDFDATLLLGEGDIEDKTKKIQAELAVKEAEWQAEKKKLEAQLRSKEEREENTQIRKHNEEAGHFDCDDISEYTTRKIYIDLALEMAGWSINNNCLEEVEVTGMPSTSGVGFADYVLYGDNGKPLAVVEAKRTSVDPKKGKVQARLYADCLEKQYGVRPFIFFTNGFETWLWDDTEYPERRVTEFCTKRELDWYFYRKANKQPLDSVSISDDITNRVYQKKAVQTVCDLLSKKQRKGLLVMATGSGKTRVSISIVDVLQKNGWIKNILFLADRRELVKQAKKNYVALMPSLSICNLLDSKDDPNSKMVFSTYPTMMNAIDQAKSKDGSRLFTAGHFDLIIIDEAHRSIYKKYQDIFTYFDAFLLGLTATPKNDIDKNTYSIFELENNVPTFAYELGEAIEEKYLVPYDTIETKMKFIEEGITYDDLSAEEQLEWEETLDEEEGKYVPPPRLNKFLFNESTVDQVLHDLMEKGIKVNGGDLIGKTIIFASNTKHADFILTRFNALYPEYAGNLASIIYNGIKYVDDEIDNLSLKDSYPQIAISVDMLDTGIDIPELVNLVFFKKVRSKAKFWQMIGRGTRLCSDLLGVGFDKGSFLIFDYCSNFEFFKANKNGIEGHLVRSLSENLFNIKVQIAQSLQHADYQEDEYQSHRLELVNSLHKDVACIDRARFNARMRLEYLDRYGSIEAWDDITDEMVRELDEHVAGLLVASQEHELSKRFDYLVYTIELAEIKGQPHSKPRGKVVKTAEKLAEKGHLPQVKIYAKLIESLQEDEYWETCNIFNHEQVRKALRDLLLLLEKRNTAIYYTTFQDEVLGVEENPGEYGGGEYVDYRKKVNAYLKKHQNDITVFKLRHNKPLTESDFNHLENLLWHELGTKKDYKEKYGDEPLVHLVAGIVGLDKSAANEMFSEFINDQNLNSQQMKFVTLVVNHVRENGLIDKKVLNDHPFNKHGSLIELFDGKIDVVKKIITEIDHRNEQIMAWG